VAGAVAGADSAGAAGVEVEAAGASAAGAGAGVGAGAAFFGYFISLSRVTKTKATFETMTTRKSFSLILRDSTFAVSFKIFPDLIS